MWKRATVIVRGDTQPLGMSIQHKDKVRDIPSGYRGGLSRVPVRYSFDLQYMHYPIYYHEAVLIQVHGQPTLQFWVSEVPQPFAEPLITKCEQGKELADSACPLIASSEAQLMRSFIERALACKLANRAGNTLGA